MAFPTGWLRKAPLVVQHGQVTGDQTALPVLITAACLPAEMVTLGGTNAAQADGGDIRFSSDSAGASQLACEIVTWIQNATPASAVVEIWVPLNVLSASDVTIYVWYKAGGGVSQPAANAAFGSQAVWDVGYQLVAHLPNGTTLTANDSTHNGWNGTVTAATAVTGKVGGGAAFVAANLAQIDFGVRNLSFGALTVSGWFKASSAVGTFFTQWADGSGAGQSFILDQNGGSGTARYQFHGNGSGGVMGGGGGTNICDGNWHYLAWAWPSITNVITGYLDGAVDRTFATDGSLITNATSNIFLGRYTNGLNFTGAGDELRISNVVRSGTWVTTEYNNQNSPATFIIPGTSTDTGGGGGGGGGSTASITCSILITGGGGGGGTSTLTCSIEIDYGHLTTECGSPPPATVGVGGFIYRPTVMMGSTALLPAYDLNQTLTWAVSGLPPGLNWDGNPSSSTYGNIVGTPTQAGTFTFSYTVSSPDGQRVTNNCPITVNPGAPGTGPSDVVSCSITIMPGDEGPFCPSDAIGGPG